MLFVSNIKYIINSPKKTSNYVGQHYITFGKEKEGRQYISIQNFKEYKDITKIIF